MDDNVTLERQAIIRGGGLEGSRPWIVATELINGREFFTVERKSTGLARFIGRGGKNSLRDFCFFDELRCRRNSTARLELLKQEQGLRSDNMIEWIRSSTLKRDPHDMQYRTAYIAEASAMPRSAIGGRGKRARKPVWPAREMMWMGSFLSCSQLSLTVASTCRK